MVPAPPQSGAVFAMPAVAGEHKSTAAIHGPHCLPEDRRVRAEERDVERGEDRVQRVRVGESVKELVCAPRAGYFIQDVV